MRIRFWGKNRIRALYCTSNAGRFLKVYWMDVSDDFKSLLSCFHTFGVRRTIDVLDSENQHGSGQIRTRSGALGLTGDVWHQKYKTKKSPLVWGTEPRIRFLAKTGSSSLLLCPRSLDPLYIVNSYIKRDNPWGPYYKRSWANFRF